MSLRDTESILASFVLYLFLHGFSPLDALCSILTPRKPNRRIGWAFKPGDFDQSRKRERERGQTPTLYTITLAKEIRERERERKREPPLRLDRDVSHRLQAPGRRTAREGCACILLG